MRSQISHESLRRAHRLTHLLTPLLVMAAALCLPGPARAQAGAAEPGALRAGRFDFGKMWTFEYAPADYFSEAYGFDAQPAWFERARLSVLRIPGCSASFVSPNGLVATNHHCVRGAVTRVARQGERLLDDGFYAQALAEERRIPDYYADQLIAIADVSDEVFRATDRAGSEAERNQAREAALEAIRARLVTQHAVPGDSVWVQLVPLYHGGRYSAYVFRRFGDVRLVAAPELQLGFFGGDSDNFTYPRHDLDFAFLRIYDREGRPYQPQHYFGWSDEGVEPGDVVFVIGNPGATNRLRTIAQLEFQRDVLVPTRIRYLESRWAILDAYRRAEPERAEALDVRNRMFGLSNSLKATRGRLVALQDAGIMARKQDAERQLESAIGADRALRQAYGKLFDRIARIQREKAKLAAEYGAFQELGGSMESAILRRALAAYSYLEGRERGMPADSLQALQGRLLRVGDNPAALEQALLAGRLADLERYLGASHSITRAALQGRAPDAAAAALRQASALADSGRTGAAIAAGTLSGEDTAVRLAAALIPAYRAYQASLDQHTQEERALESDLGRARFEVYGRDVPPDGTFSPRITDGVVQGYEYNGTLAPPYTTFYGLYNLYSAHGPGTEWELPARWLTPPAALDLATPLNFVSTADTYGGNSGSPAVTPELELVGLNFDRNIEGLSRDFIYLPERGRNVMVDVRAIRAALDHVYDADRIVLELETGELYETEAAADAVGSR